MRLRFATKRSSPGSHRAPGVPVFEPSSIAGRALALSALLLFLPAVGLTQTSTVGQWAASVAWPFAASHAALLRDGRVLVWNDIGAAPQVWDPGPATFASSGGTAQLPGKASVQLGDRTLAILGGLAANDTASTQVVRYRVSGNLWQTLPSMLRGRESPTVVLLGDGRMLTLSGNYTTGVMADYPEKAAPGSGWVSLLDASFTLPRRPWAVSLSDGRVLVAGPDRTARILDASTTGSWTVISDMLLGGRPEGTAVAVPGTTDRVLVMGGRDPATPTCEILDLPTSLAWRSTASMANGRRYANATILADGSILVTGGTLIGDDAAYAVLGAELFDPVAETWTAMASMTVARRRGSVALLLPDGRVLVAGGGDGTTGHELHADAQTYSPPYLFKGTRPTITAAPDSIGYGANAVVTTPDAATITKIWLVRAGSVSDGFNADQRGLQLAFTIGGGQVTATAPASANAAPPGTYLLYLVKNTGVPSVAKILRLYQPPPPGSVPHITSTPSASGSVGVQYVYIPQSTGSTPQTWSLVTGPSWLIVNSANGICTGIPTAIANAAVTLRATNSFGFEDQSWSIVVTGTPRTLIPIGATWRYFKGTSDPGATWTNIGYNDSGWLQGPSGFGFGDNDDATVLSDMINNYTTVYTRYKFNLYAKQSVTQISVLYDYDDGFAAFLNGTRFFEQKAPATITNTSTATGSHEAIFTLTRQDFTTPSTLNLLQNGQNVLAVVGFNASIGNNDLTLKIQFEVTGGNDLPVDVQPAGWNPPMVSPNPFLTTTQFRFAQQAAGDARLELFDVRGRRIRTVYAPQLGAGPNIIEWDGRDAAGRGVNPGVYFYRLVIPEQERRGKLVRSSTAPAAR